jgi:metal-responsive CopG/Arc/MetJ family transcriptional regulator
MKTAVSMPDAVFSRAEIFARRRRMTRSALFTAAVNAYLDQHQPESVTRALNAIYAKEDSTLDPVLQQAQALSLPKEDWE